MNKQEMINWVTTHNVIEKCLPLWILTFYDHMLSGICLYKNNDEFILCYINLIDEKDDLIYGVYRLTDEEQDMFYNQHVNFQKYVGYNCDLIDMGSGYWRGNNLLRDKKDWDTYYSNDKNNIDVDVKQIISKPHIDQYKI